MHELTHIRKDGTITMVDVGNKPKTMRTALAEGFITLSQTTFDLLKNQALPKGDALACAKIAGILAAKQTPHLIPLCHPLHLTFIDIRPSLIPTDPPKIRIESEVRSLGETGVEMEAIVAVSIALTTIYDMCKAVQRDMVIGGIRLLEKTGGMRGDYKAEG
ncbi:MAG: cyclic pyranopterin monophosphate synthase MoaC [Desulfovibrio sp.]|nr:cyclic pyranopterin monophosphate synthase MoaC [Desulfovibrio sp.]